MYRVEYDGNDNESYTLFFNQEPKAELLLNEDGAIEIVAAINNFLEEFSSVENSDAIVVKNNDGKLGVIVDVWDGKEDECFYTMVFWFDDYRE